MALRGPVLHGVVACTAPQLDFYSGDTAGIGLSASAIQSGHFRFAAYLPFAIANSIDGMVGAFIASRLIETRESRGCAMC